MDLINARKMEHIPLIFCLKILYLLMVFSSSLLNL